MSDDKALSVVLSHHLVVLSRQPINILLRHAGINPDALYSGRHVSQRVALARALANDLPIVLADEAMGNLDSHSGTLVLDLLYRSCKEIGKTLILATHDHAVVQRTALPARSARSDSPAGVPQSKA